MVTNNAYSALLKENGQDNPSIPIEETAQPEQTKEQRSEERKNRAQKIAPFTLTQWNNLKPLIQQKHPELTDEDLIYEEGKYNELYDRVQKRFDEILDNAKMVH